MTRFTNSPLEPFMRQRPGGGAKPRPVLPPKGHKCHGCAFFKGVRCVGICYRDLLSHALPKP